MPYPTPAQKHLVIDGRMLNPRGHGIANYLVDLLNGIAIRKNLLTTHRITILVPKDSGNWIRHFIPQELGIQECVSNFLALHEQWEIPSLLKRLKADLYFSPSFASLVYCPCPFIQTVHDLNHIHYGNLFQKTYYKLLLAPSLQRAKKIVTVSKFSQEEIANWLNIQPQNIVLIPNAVQVPKEIMAPNRSPYLLALSNSKPHKNMSFLFRAYEEYADSVGGQALPLLTNIDSNDLPKGVEKITVNSNAALWGYLQSARALFFPSLYEGFGRPPLEAAIIGIPVIASDIPPHHEALSLFPSQLKQLISPKNRTLWAEAMRLAGKNLLSRPSEAEIESAKNQFSIDKLAEAYEKIFAAI